MGQIISKTKIKREKGWLYYTGTDEEGNLTICKSRMYKGKMKISQIQKEKEEKVITEFNKINSHLENLSQRIMRMEEEFKVKESE